MRERLVQVLRLPVLPQAPAQAPVDAEAVPGLGLAFPACPECAHKVIRRPAADTTDRAADTSEQQQQVVWVCRNCHGKVHGAGIVWTYRIMTSVAGVSGASGVAASVMGAAAEAWFGCTAAQWMSETSDALQALARYHPGASACALLEYMRDRLAALVGMVSGISGNHALVDLRCTPAVAARNRAAQYHVSRIWPVAAAAAPGGPARIIRLWRFTVYDALLAAHAQQPSECAESEQLLRALEADTRSLRITSELAAPRSVAELSPATDAASAAADDATWPDDGGEVLAAWAQVHGLRAEPTAPRISVPSATSSEEAGISTAMSNIDSLLDNTSQLFVFDNSMPLAELLDDNDPLSVQHFEESLRDEHTDSLFFDSQLSFGLLESQMSLRSGQAVLGGAGWSQPEHLSMDDRPAGMLPYTPPSTLRRRLEATPAAVSQVSPWGTPVRSGPARASQPTPISIRRASTGGDGPVVLAEETPTAPSHGSKRKLEFFVPETPLPVKGARCLPAGSQQQPAPDTPTMRRSASSGTAWAVPETPTAREPPAQRATKAGQHKTHGRYRPLAMAGSDQPGQAPLDRHGRHARGLRPLHIELPAGPPAIPALVLGPLRRSSSSAVSADDATSSNA
ncbi:hypothetical protein H4R19_003674 [Coemansia spiralis]|nr:hypothetical protein H4R19_003674 [Coemansia spiralis]